MAQDKEHLDAESSRTNILSNSLKFLPILFSILYIYAYCYELGYAHYFGYPIAWVKFELGMLGNFLSSQILFITYIFLFFQLAFQYTPATQRYVVSIVFACFMIGLLQIAIEYFAPQEWKVASIYAAFAVVTFGLLLSVHRLRAKSGSGSDFVPSAYDRKSQVPEGTIAHFFLSRFRFDPLLYIYLFLFLFPILFATNGYIEAEQKKSFFKFSFDNNFYLALRISDSSIIASPYENHREFFTKGYLTIATEQVGLLEEIRLRE